MQELTLVAWVRGELPAAQRREVTEWMVRCADPRLPLLLSGILQAERDARRDQALLSRVPEWAALVQGWQRLVEQGRGLLLDGPSADFAMASTVEGSPEILRLVERGEQSVAVVRGTESAHLHLLISSDAGRVESLGDKALTPGETWELPVGLQDERSTLWLIVGVSPEPDEPLKQLQDALATTGSAGVLAALRVDPRSE